MITPEILQTEDRKLRLHTETKEKISYRDIVEGEEEEGYGDGEGGRDEKSKEHEKNGERGEVRKLSKQKKMKKKKKKK